MNFLTLLFEAAGLVLLAIIIRIAFQFYILRYLVSYTEIDDIDYLRHMEHGDTSGLPFLIFKKLVEKNLLLNYRALSLIRRLAEAGFISESIHKELLKIIQSAIDQAAIASVGADNMHIYLLNLRFKPFWGTLEAARVYEDWRKLLKEQRCLARAFWFYGFWRNIGYLKTSRTV